VIEIRRISVVMVDWVKESVRAGKKDAVVVQGDDDNVVVVGDASAVEEVEEELEASNPPSRSFSGNFGSIVRWVSDSLGGRNQEKKLLETLRKSTMFKYCSEKSLLALMNSMKFEEFKKGDTLMRQGEEQSSAIIVVDGEVARLRVIDDQLHYMATLGTQTSASSIGTLHLLREEATFATVRALSDGALYRLNAQVFTELLEESPEFSQEVIYSLAKEVRAKSRLERTPLFLQSGKAMPSTTLPWFAISCAAAIESFYRSGLNAILNAALTGQKRAALFPNMHVQIPTRILYINGFKSLRFALESRVPISSYENPQLVGMGIAIIPGVVMSPISSILEASNAGHANPEPLSVRWIRGIVPRCAREVIFGIGINQLSDYFEERMDSFVSDQNLRNLGGSLVSGVIAGYLSHLPHNLSTLKLLQPKRSYRQHFSYLCEPWAQWVDRELVSNASRNGGKAVTRTTTFGTRAFRSFAVPALTILLPKGALIRTAQITGSFVIINSTINLLSHINVNLSISRTASS